MSIEMDADIFMA